MFKRDCLFCGERYDPKDPKNPQIWVPVNQCVIENRPGQPSFKQVILDICDERQDDWSRMVAVRVNGAQTDLTAADAQYHTHCYNKFRKVPKDSTKAESCKTCVDESLKSVINYMKYDMCATWTVVELHGIYTQSRCLSI